MRKAWIVGVLLSCSVSLGGCAALLMEATGGASTGRKIDAAKVNQVKRGVTTRAQVTDFFGKPSSKSSGSSGESWSYEYGHDSMISGQEIQLLTIQFLGDVVESVNFTEQTD